MRGYRGSVMNRYDPAQTLNIKSKVSEKIKHSDRDNSLSKWKSSNVEKKFQRLKICKECVKKMTQNSKVKKYYFENTFRYRNIFILRMNKRVHRSPHLFFSKKFLGF